MTNRWNVVLAGAVVAALAGAGVVGSSALAAQTAQPQERPGRMGRMGPMGPHGRGPMGLGFALAQLDLTDAQRSQVQSIRQQHREEFAALGERARTARRALDDAVSAPTVDEGAIRAAATAWSEVETDMALARARAHSEIWQVLTPEQRTKADELRGQARDRMQQRGRAWRDRMQAQPAPPQPKR